MRLRVSRVGAPACAVAVSGRHPGATSAIQGSRLSIPKFCVGGTRSGWSRLPIVTSMCGASRKRNVSGVPQAAQKSRQAAGELWNAAGRPRVHVRSALSTLASAANNPPVAFWHIRQ